MKNGNLHDCFCADALRRLNDWTTARDLGASPGQLRSLTAAGLVRSSPDYRNYRDGTAHNHPRVYHRTKAGDRAAELLTAVQEESP
jgi:hypothetical protein